MSTDHERLQRDIGVYVLGGLDPADRERLERHVADCVECRDEIASLAILPSMLSRAGAANVLAPEPPPFAHVAARLADERRRSRRRTRVLAAAACLAVLIAAASVAGLLQQRSDRRGTQFVGTTPGVTAAVEQRAWGMAVEIRADDLPPANGYVAMAISSSGHRTQVASWTATDSPVSVSGACYLDPSEVERMEIVSAPDQQVVAVLRAAGG